MVTWPDGGEDQDGDDEPREELALEHARGLIVLAAIFSLITNPERLAAIIVPGFADKSE